MKINKMAYRLVANIAGVFVCIVAVAGTVYAKEPPPPMEYAYPDQSVWTTKKASDGVLKNPLLGVAEVIFSELGIAWSAKPYPANRLFFRLENGISYFSMLVKATRLQKCCIFSEKPITYVELRIYRRVGVASIKTAEDLNGKDVITVLGYSYGQLGKHLDNKKNSITRFAAGRHAEAFKMFELGRADYLLDYAGPSEEILSERPVEGITYDVFKRVNVFVVLSRTYPNAEELMGQIENVAANIDVTQWGLERL